MARILVHWRENSAEIIYHISWVASFLNSVSENMRVDLKTPHTA